MTKVLFVCHGNICRSPMAEFVFRDMLSRGGYSDIETASCATSTEEIGNPVHSGTVKKLRQVGISCAGKRARQLNIQDIHEYDYIVAMERYNIDNIHRLLDRWRVEPEIKALCESKLHLLRDFTPSRGDIADPWYTGDFDITYEQILEGCQGLVNHILSTSR